MNLIKTLSHLGFQPEDYTISGDDFTMTLKTTSVQVSHAEFDEEGQLLFEAEIEEVDVTPEKPSEEQLQSAWEEVQLKECDIALLISEYVKDAERDPENDCLNIVDGLLHSFSFTHIGKPTNFQLLELKASAEAKQSQKAINEQALKYLAETDYMVLREVHDPSKPVSEEIKQLRQAARDSIVR